jgi:hypothetical protein
MTTDEPTVRQWQEIFSPAAASPADRSAAEPDITAMRARLREAVNACTDLAMDQAVLILENHRLRRLLDEAERRPDVEVAKRREATALLEYALHLRMWPEFDRRAEAFLRTHGAAAAVSATATKAWADLAYEMWDLLGDSVPAGGVGTDNYARKRGLLRRRLAAMIENGGEFGPHQADHGPGTWSPQPDSDGNLTVEEAVGQALGTASMCWIGGTGSLEFDSFQAAKVHVGIMAFLADWADHIRKQANEGTAAKMLARENWT